jgi:cobalt/nickel transport system permease protein
MHIPDGFLDAKTALGTGALAATGLGFALRHARKTLPPRKIPLLGLSAAFVFAAQMLNFPVAGGTSGHLIGGVLAAALLGPSAAVIVISSVLIVQCFMFADGGIAALGANILNMGIIGGAVGGILYGFLTRYARTLFGRLVAAIVTSWAVVVLASAVCAGELAASGTSPWNVALPAMTVTHALIGIGEGVITALVLAAIAAARPELVLHPAGARTGGAPATEKSIKPVLVFGLIAALGLALFVAPFACPWPDGLDKAAETLGFSGKESADRALAAPAPDYKIPGISSPAMATGLAGAAGTLVVLAGAWLVARALVPREKPVSAIGPST